MELLNTLFTILAIFIGSIIAMIIVLIDYRIKYTRNMLITHAQNGELYNIAKKIKTEQLSRMMMNIDKDSHEVYMSELDNMITIYTITKVDEVFGTKFRTNKGIGVNIETADVLEVVSSVGTNIINHIKNTPMHRFLYYYMGRMKTQQYIMDKAMAITINYCKEKKTEILTVSQIN